MYVVGWKKLRLFIMTEMRNESRNRIHDAIIHIDYKHFTMSSGVSEKIIIVILLCGVEG